MAGPLHSSASATPTEAVTTTPPPGFRARTARCHRGPRGDSLRASTRREEADLADLAGPGRTGAMLSHGPGARFWDAASQLEQELN